MYRLFVGAGGLGVSAFLGYELNLKTKEIKQRFQRHRQLSSLDIKTFGQYYRVDIDAMYPPRSKGICDNRVPKPQGPPPELSLTAKLENPFVQGMGIATSLFTTGFLVCGPSTMLRTFFGTFALGSAVVSAGTVHATPSHEDPHGNIAKFRTTMITAPVTVIRHDKHVKVTGNDVNIGELIVLTAGSIAPGDVRVIHVTNPREGLVVQPYNSHEGKPPGEVQKKNAATVPMANTRMRIEDEINIVSAGSTVVKGGGLAVVYAKGTDTYHGALMEVAQYALSIDSSYKWMGG